LKKKYGPIPTKPTSAYTYISLGSFKRYELATQNFKNLFRKKFLNPRLVKHFDSKYNYVSV